MPNVLECCDNDQVDPETGEYREVYLGHVKYVLSVISSERRITESEALAALRESDRDNPIVCRHCRFWSEFYSKDMPVDPTAIIPARES